MPVSTPEVAVQTAANMRCVHLGPLEGLSEHFFTLPNDPQPRYGKAFLQPHLGLTGMEVSLNRVDPGQGVPFLHKHHKNEELYIFVRGRGQFQVDGQVVDVQEGTALVVRPNGTRAWRNNSTEPLYYVVVQALEGSQESSGVEDGYLAPGDVVWTD